MLALQDEDYLCPLNRHSSEGWNLVHKAGVLTVSTMFGSFLSSLALYELGPDRHQGDGILSQISPHPEAL